MPIKEATVVDAWNNYKVQTLEQFCAGDNPYHKPIYLYDIQITDAITTNGIEPITEVQKKCFEMAAENVYQLYLDSGEYFTNREAARIGDYLNYSSGISDGAFDFPRHGRSVNDTRGYR